MALRLPSYRAFKKFIGELTAASAGIEVSVRHAISAAAEDSDPDPWQKLGQKVGIRLDGVPSERISSAASRLQLVSGYSGFDAFMRGLRSDWQRLSASQWSRTKGDTPFQEIRRNVPQDPFKPGPEEYALEYYRLCRNWIAHPAESTTQEASDYFNEKAEELAKVREAWRCVGDEIAPSRPTDLSFRDVKLFARVSLHLAEVISEAFDPGDEALCRFLPMQAWSRLAHDAAGQRRAAAGYLQTMLGIDRDRAIRIAEMAIGAN
jgi:hypothetical protein